MDSSRPTRLAALQGRKRALLTLCTGAGKTAVAFQICWKLWSAGWNAAGIHRKPRILYLADNSGEIVFDRLLIETLGPDRVTLMVKAGPIVNDVTREDLAQVGLEGLVRVVDTGCNYFGFPWEYISEAAREELKRNAGTQFDPKLVQLFVSKVQE